MSLSALILTSEKWESFLPWELVVFLGKYLPFLMFLFSLFFLIKKAKKRDYLFILFSLASAEVLTLVVSFLTKRIRPYVLLGSVPISDPFVFFSFPSSHATVLFALSTCFLFIDRNWAVFLFFGSLLVCLARVVGGLHFPSDILMGASVGIFFSLALRKIIYEK